MKLNIKKGAVDQTVFIFVPDSSKTTGEGLTGLAYNTASLVAYYIRPGGTATAITLATLAAVDSAHSDGGFKEVSSTNMPGIYRLDLPDAVVATGVGQAVVMLKGATNMTPVALELQLVDHDPGTATTDFADALLNRDMATGTDSGSPTVRTVRQALRALRNKFAISGVTYTVYKEDDTTASWTSTVTTNAAADPITSSDPASS